MTRPTAILAIVVVALVAGACGVLGGGSDLPTVLQPTPVASPRATPVPPATPEPTPNPTATPVAEPLFTSREAENIVFVDIRNCADQVSSARALPVAAVMDSVFDSAVQEWQVTVTSKDKLINFGTWRVDDSNGVVTPGNAIAGSINDPSIICGVPIALISGAPTTPIILSSTPPPVVVPSALVQSSEQANLLVWSRVYSCYDNFPELDSFTANREPDGDWVVVGLSDTTQYGLWRVLSADGDVRALDGQASRAANACGLRDAGVDVTGVTQGAAALRVWSAVYDCFTPSPEFASFVERLESSKLVIVESRGETTTEVEVQRIVSGTTETFTEDRIDRVFYGMWLVETKNLTISPWDSVARATALKSCFQVPFG